MQPPVFADARCVPQVDLASFQLPPSGWLDALLDRRDAPIAFELGFDADIGVTIPPGPAPRTSPRDDGRLDRLLDRIVRREESALAELHRACADTLLALALRILRRPEMACEAVSSTFLQVWNRARDFDGARANVLSWLGMIVRSRALDMLRQQRARGQHECALVDDELESVDGNALQPCGRVERSEQQKGLRRAMATLTPMQRQVLSLVFLEGRSHEEAAAHIGVPLGTLKSHSRRGLAALRAHAGLRAAQA